jgi:hypothetical protein
MAPYGDSYEPEEKVSPASQRKTIWVVTGSVVFLVVLIFVFLAVSGHLERRSYYQPSNQNPPAAANPPATTGP